MLIAQTSADSAAELTTKRKIYFYEVDAGAQPDGRPVEWNPEPCLGHVCSLSPEDRYLETADKDVLFVNPMSVQAPQKLIFVRSRRMNLPELERRGRMSPLNIPRDGGLGEKTHIMFFGRYAAADFNYYGPRATTLPAYLTLKAKLGFASIRLRLMVRASASEDLRRLEGATQIEMKFRDSAIAVAERASDSLAAALRANLRATDADECHLIWKRKSKRGVLRYLDQEITDGVRRLAQDPSTYQEFEKFRIHGVTRDTYERKLIDLLNDQLVQEARFVKLHPRHRAVDSNSAFVELERAFDSMLPTLKAAGTVE